MMHLYSALLCIAVHPKHFTIMCGGGGVSPQPPPVNSFITNTPLVFRLDWGRHFERLANLMQAKIVKDKAAVHVLVNKDDKYNFVSVGVWVHLRHHAPAEVTCTVHTLKWTDKKRNNGISWQICIVFGFRVREKTEQNKHPKATYDRASFWQHWVKILIVHMNDSEFTKVTLLYCTGKREKQYICHENTKKMSVV